MLPAPRPQQAALSDRIVRQLASALASQPAGDSSELETALLAVCVEARQRDLQPEVLVHAMRSAWALIPKPRRVSHDEWSRAYYTAVGRCLGVYFGGR